jgi:branched-chain amino acid transport system substrate-binding protein
MRNEQIVGGRLIDRRDFLKLTGAGLAGVTLLGTAGCGGETGSDSGGEGVLKFGLITDITKFSDFGIRTRDGVQMAVDQINENGGVNGHQVEIVFGDSAADPQEAATLTRTMAEDDEVLAIWGPFTSGSVEVAFPQANQLEVPIIASTSAKPGLAGENRPWAFRNIMTDAKLLEPALAQFAEDYGLQRVAVASDIQEPIAKATGTVTLPKLAQELGLEVVNVDDPVTWQTGEQNFSSQVTSLKGLDADALLLGTTAGDAARLATEMQRQNLDIPAIGGVSMFNESLIDQAGDAVEGWYTAGVFWKGSEEERVQEFVGNIREYHKESFPENPDPIQDSATWYDTAKITMMIAEEKGITPDTPLDEARTQIRKGWANLEGYEGVSGTTSIGEDGEAQKEVLVMKVEDGEFTRVK